MPIVFTDPTNQGINQALIQGTGALSQALQQRAANRLNQQRFEQQQQIADRRLREKEQFQRSLLDQKLQQQQRLEEMKMARERESQQQEQQAYISALDAMIGAGGPDTPEGRLAFTDAYMRSGGKQLQPTMKSLATMQSRPEQRAAEKLSPVQKEIEEQKAAVVKNYLTGGRDAQARQKQNIAFLEQNIPKVGRQKYITGGEFVTPSALFQEYATTGDLVLESVIKVFNPAGALPTNKLKWIQDTFSVKPSDTQEVLRGKLNSMKRLMDEVEPMQEELAELIEKHNGEIPTKDFIRLRKQATQILDKRIEADQYKGAQILNQLPDPAQYKGKIMIDPKTGNRVISNGKRWVKYRGE